MNYNLYILYSENHKRTYTGQTNNLRDRLKRHNSGKVKSITIYTNSITLTGQTFPHYFYHIFVHQLICYDFIISAYSPNKLFDFLLVELIPFKIFRIFHLRILF
ncbi:MAG: GIY-YIG nuclease family protein [Melioribacteraceae bacterium]|nr:GIY-YIG nuclease family protein [Melioribacteraceae bacterium]MCF8396201.1 GIY-YIG nuclease family protein [Melioribacteraceae bacterium]MCF8420543.1 GIY-YIG nuclease family protein [Melioribacteraceae bacterium]